MGNKKTKPISLPKIKIKPIQIPKIKINSILKQANTALKKANPASIINKTKEKAKRKHEIDNAQKRRQEIMDEIKVFGINLTAGISTQQGVLNELIYKNNANLPEVDYYQKKNEELVEENTRLTEKINTLWNTINDYNSIEKWKQDLEILTKQIIILKQHYDMLQDEITKKILVKLDKQKIQTKILETNYGDLKTNDRFREFGLILEQNKLIRDEIVILKNKQNIAKTDGKTRELQSIQWFNRLIFFVYYGFVFLFFVLLFTTSYGNNKSTAYKVFVFICLLLMPNIAFYLELFLMYSWDLIFNTLYGTAIIRIM